MFMANFFNIYFFSQNLKKFKFALNSETVRDRAKRKWDSQNSKWSQHNIFDSGCMFFENFHCCIFVQTFILAAYVCKFYSGCTFVQNSIQAAYLWKFSYLLHICEHFNVYNFLCNFSLSCPFKQIDQNLKIQS